MLVVRMYQYIELKIQRYIDFCQMRLELVCLSDFEKYCQLASTGIIFSQPVQKLLSVNQH